jgi:hypothetical protein
MCQIFDAQNSREVKWDEFRAGQGKIDPIVGEFRIGAIFKRELQFDVWFCSEFITGEEHCMKQDVDKANKNEDFAEDFQISVWSHR